MRVLVADDHPQVRSALGLLLEHEPQVQVVGEATYAEDLIHQIRETQPDLVLLDWELPGLPAIDLLRTIRTYRPGLLVIALSGRPEAHHSALLAGVDDFISKGNPPEQVLTILRAFNSSKAANIYKEQIKDWMTRQVVTVSPDTTLPDADSLMRQRSIRRLPVVKEDKLVGMITRDDVRGAKLVDTRSLNIWQLNYLLSTLRVEAIMTLNPITISEEATISEAAQMMKEHKISGLPVLNDQGKIVGIITESDIFRTVVQRWNAGGNP